MILIKENNSAAFEEIYHRYSKILLHFLYKMLSGDEEQAQDFLHDIFLRIIEKPYLFDRNKKFKTWIFQIASNLCKNEYRRRDVRNNVKNNLELKSLAIDTIEMKSSPEDVIDKKQFHDLVFSEIDKFKQEHRSTFIMRFQHGLSIKEIAGVLECPQGTVKSRLFYVTKKLLKIFKQYNPHQIGV